MAQVELSPEARGVLNALKVLGAVRNYEEKTAWELVSAGLAEIREDKLAVTSRGMRGIRMLSTQPN